MSTFKPGTGDAPADAQPTRARDTRVLRLTGQEWDSAPGEPGERSFAGREKVEQPSPEDPALPRTAKQLRGK
jgi:hypothetical protein